MKGYWVRQRLITTLIICVALAAITGLLFVFPYISQQANNYNAQSIYKNTDIDFIVPEPSDDQVAELPGTNGVDKVFPYYLTKTQVAVAGNSRTTTVLLSDQFQNIDITMYNKNRLIEKASEEYDNPILVDWQFCNDTSAQIGDTVSFSIDGGQVEFKIYAIYETNSVYDGGAILAQITAVQKEAIMHKSKNSGYSGAYISSSDYNECRNYLITDYRPLGRLKSREQFEDESQYQVHYDAIMSSGYANEITDFRSRESGMEKSNSPIMVLIATALSIVILIAFNILMSKRGCEKVYFTKHCIPKGQNVKPYYKVSFAIELLLFMAVYAGVVIFKISSSSVYIPGSVLNVYIGMVPVAVFVAEIVSLMLNNSMVADITKNVKQDEKKKQLDNNVDEG
jgi:hypothetical protein